MKDSDMRALVLSGGAAFGAYQAGVWKSLEALHWQPDVIVGISIGSVNAYMLAHGASNEEMTYLWKDLPGELGGVGHSKLSPWKHLGLFRNWLDVIVERFAERPQICEMRAVVLEAPSLRFRVTDCRSHPKSYLAAACALPGILPPVRIDGRWLLDCGATRHLPIREALSLGATEIIAVDLLKHYPVPLVRLARRGILSVRDFLHNECSEPGLEELKSVSLSVVAHSSPLGSLTDAFRWNPEHIGRLLEAGYEDGMELLADALAAPVAS